MFAKILSFVFRAKRVLNVIMTVLDVVGGVIEAAKASGYKLPGQQAQAVA